MSDFVTSLIRTYVPIAVGAVIAWLTAKGLTINPNDVVGVVGFLTAIIQGLYYLVVRLLERKFPQFGWLLGQAKSVNYTEEKQ